MYKSFYYLNDRPFALKPDQKYFYIARPHQRVIEELRAGFERPDGVCTLIGKKGSGKTSLIAYMLDQLEKNDHIVATVQQPPQKTRDFLQAIMAALQIPVTEQQPKVLLNTLNAFLYEQAALRKKVLLVVDDAESLSQNCLELIRLLSALRRSDHGLLQIVLVGTDALEATLSANGKHDFSRQISSSYRLQPLQASDTREYIEHRLAVAGWNGDPAIDDDAFDAIHQLTGGVPSAINRYCDRLLMLGMLRETHHLTAEDISNLTSATMEKLENLEASRQEPPFSPHLETYTVTPTPRVVKEFDFEKYNFNTQATTSKPLFTKQTLITVAAACLVVSISGVIFKKMSATDPSPTSATSAGHAEIDNHSGVDAGSSAPDSGSETAKYILEEIPAASSAKAGGDAADSRLLDIQQLVKKFDKADTAEVVDPVVEGLPSEANL